MFEVIAGGIAGGIVGGGLTGALIWGRGRGRFDEVAAMASAAWGNTNELVANMESYVTREELQGIFAGMAAAEQEQRMQAEMARMQQAQQAELQRLRAMAAQQPAPVFRNEAAAGAFQSEAGGRPAPPDPAQINAQLQQQLASLNQRLQQVTSQRMPQG